MSFRSVFVAFITVLVAFPLLAMEAPLPRHPAPSPDGSSIAFSWQGDLWVVPASGGEARRLTAHPAAERHPVWSRDGSSIAFASSRHGNGDVFVMAADGSSPPRRLTFASEHDVPVDFTADGSSLLFTSNRADSNRWMPGLYLVSVAGGTPTLAQPALGRNAAYSPGGETLAFVRGDTKWPRRGYRGAADRDLWLAAEDGSFVQLTDFDGDDDFPSWVDGHTLAFLSARAGRKNVFLMNVVNGSVEALTEHQGSDVRFPRAAADGSVVAYEFEDAVWTVTGDGKPIRLSISVPADHLANTVERRTQSEGGEDLVVNPDGDLAAFVVHGDVFIVELRSKEDQEIAAPRTVQVTATPTREKDLSWAPDGSSLLLTSARSGNEDLFLVRPADEEAGWIESYDFSVEQLTSSPEEDSTARFSPAGEEIAFVRGKGNLMVMAVDGSAERAVLEHWQTPDFDWSPDGRWIAYSIPDAHYNAEVWIVAQSGGEPYNVSRHPDDDHSPRWSRDGRRLIWVSKRHADTEDIWGVWLRRADHERSPAQWLKLWSEEEETADGKGDKKETEGDSEADLPEVVIDFDRLWERAHAITDLQGDEGMGLVGPEGKRVIFTADHEGERDLYSVRWDGEDRQRLTEGGERPSEIQLDAAGETLYYLDKDGRINRIGLDGTAGDAAPFTARYSVDVEAEHGAVFDEAWRALNDWFYDPDFHGVDWPAQHRKYRPWALAASHEDDFADVLNLMLGELNASHMGYRVRRGGGGGDATGWIGALWDPAAGGPGILVAGVVPDSPADRRDVELAAGDRLLSVNGHAVETSTNIYSLFADTVGERVWLEIQAADGATRRAAVYPVDFDTYEELRYQEWVRARRRLTEHLSAGRLGYLHVQSMNQPSFEDFERSLFAAGHDKEGLIIDVRSNGGGWTTDLLMAALNVRRHAFTVPRDDDSGVKAYPQGRLPLAAWTRPALTLCNEDSYSNAEIFSHAFKELDRGPLVGMPTFGAVISTGAANLLDGNYVRLPMRGWYVAGSGMNMELNGAQPDILVPQPPEQDTTSKPDTQLAKAVEALLESLEQDPRYGAW